MTRTDITLLISALCVSVTPWAILRLDRYFPLRVPVREVARVLSSVQMNTHVTAYVTPTRRTT